MCYGPCAIFKVTLRRGGRAELQVRSWRDWRGNYAGMVSVSSYGRLCYLLVKIGFDRFPTGSGAQMIDAPSTVLTVVGQGRTKQVVSSPPGIVPIELWGAQETIEAVAQDVSWQK